MFRAVDKWLLGYLRAAARRSRRVPTPRHLLFCVADHYEPYRAVPGRHVADTEARELVGRWCGDYRTQVAGFRDADGFRPRHTFFYPAEDYDAGCLDLLASACAEGVGEVEIHLHHRDDTRDVLAATLSASGTRCPANTGSSAATGRVGLVTASCMATGRCAIRGRTATGAGSTTSFRCWWTRGVTPTLRFLRRLLPRNRGRSTVFTMPSTRGKPVPRTTASRYRWVRHPRFPCPRPLTLRS